VSGTSLLADLPDNFFAQTVAIIGRDRRMIQSPRWQPALAGEATSEEKRQCGIHWPHAGEHATPALTRRHAERAEDLVWRSACAPPNPLSAVARAVAARARRDRSIHRADISARIATLHAAAGCPAVNVRRRKNDWRWRLKVWRVGNSVARRLSPLTRARTLLRALYDPSHSLFFPGQRAGAATAIAAGRLQ
jgi:hypothetical protein